MFFKNVLCLISKVLFSKKNYENHTGNPSTRGINLIWLQVIVAIFYFNFLEPPILYKYGDFRKTNSSQACDFGAFFSQKNLWSELHWGSFTANYQKMHPKKKVDEC
jgi:hypothetical protein